MIKKFMKTLISPLTSLFETKMISPEKIVKTILEKTDDILILANKLNEDLKTIEKIKSENNGLVPPEKRGKIMNEKYVSNYSFNLIVSCKNINDFSFILLNSKFKSDIFIKGYIELMKFDSFKNNSNDFPLQTKELELTIKLLTQYKEFLKTFNE